MRSFRTRARQQGQALIYGIFVLFGALAATFFMFNTGQLSAEKTKLVNTADAVAYSAGVMHARALNFTAYTNRALVANETTMAQMVSISSWLKYADDAVDQVPVMNCYYVYTAVPVALATAEYAPLCFALSWGYASLAIEAANTAFDNIVPLVTVPTEFNKQALKAAQLTMSLDLVIERNALLQQVANANYKDNGAVVVDDIPLLDNYSLFEGAPFITRREGDERTRMREVALASGREDKFVRERKWNSKSPWSCFLPTGEADRTGGTTLQDFDTWRAADRAEFIFGTPDFFGCDKESVSLGSGSQSTSSSTSSEWHYSGISEFFSLSNAALEYTPEHDEADKRDPRLRFAIRVTRARTEQRTSAGRSPVKPTGRLDLYAGSQANNKMAAVATSEVFFDRPVARADGKRELANLFNPYWQVHLISNPAAVTTAALIAP